MDNEKFLEGTFDPYIGHEILEIKENYVKSRLEVKDFHKQPMGMVHGGVIDTMAEAAISYAAYYTQEGYLGWRKQQYRFYKSCNGRNNYL